MEQHQVADADHKGQTAKFVNCFFYLLHDSALYDFHNAHDGDTKHPNQGGENGGIQRQGDDVFDEFEHGNLFIFLCKTMFCLHSKLYKNIKTTQSELYKSIIKR